MDKYIGFDIDSQKTVACVVQNGKKDLFETFPSNLKAMKNFLKKHQQRYAKLHLTFEISGQAGYWYDGLIDSVDDITVSNPHKMTWIFRTSKKNDRIDARKQAILLSIDEIPKVHMPNQDIRQWRTTLQHRRTVIKHTTSVKNRIRALLKANGHLKSLHTGSWWKKANRAWMMRLTSQEPIDSESLWRLQLADLLDALALKESQLKRITKYLDSYLEQQPGATLLMSIPGIGPRTAEAILAYTDDIKRFKRSKQYCAYFGLTPKLDESGSVRRLGRISKEGPSLVRWLLVESAWRTVKKSPALQDFYVRVQSGQKNRKGIAVVAVARKLLTIIRSMLITGELFNEELVGQAITQEKIPA